MLFVTYIIYDGCGICAIFTMQCKIHLTFTLSAISLSLAECWGHWLMSTVHDQKQFSANSASLSSWCMYRGHFLFWYFRFCVSFCPVLSQRRLSLSLLVLVKCWVLACWLQRQYSPLPPLFTYSQIPAASIPHIPYVSGNYHTNPSPFAPLVLFPSTFYCSSHRSAMLEHIADCSSLILPDLNKAERY